MGNKIAALYRCEHGTGLGQAERAHCRFLLSFSLGGSGKVGCYAKFSILSGKEKALWQNAGTLVMRKN